MSRARRDGSREQVPLNTVAAIRTGLNQAEGGASNAGESAQKASAIPTRDKLQSGGPTSSGQASSPRGGEEAGATSSDVENVGPAPSGVTEAGATQRHVADAAAQSAVQPKRSHVSGNAVAYTPSAMMEGARSVVEPSVKTVAERPAAAEAKPDRARGRSVAAVGGSDAAASLRGSDQRTIKTDVRRPDAQEDTAAVANEDAPEDKSARIPVQPRIAVSNAEAGSTRRGDARTLALDRWSG